MEGTWGKGIGVFLNVKGVDDGGGHTDAASSEADRTKSVEAETTELEKQGLEDSEMNGVSSLLKMRASAREIDKHGLAEPEGDNGTPVQGFGAVYWDKEEELGHDHEPTSGVDGVLYEVQIHGGVMERSYGDAGEESDEEVDEVGGGYEFSVGDFVWGKIKSHPWWPGRVYDPSDASDFAVKKIQRNKLLVAYFGDNSFAWCHSSQLKPFAENFGEFSKMSHSRNFLTAVVEAIDQVERLVVLNLTCSCVQENTGTALEWPKASSAGLKDGLFVPGGRIGLLEPIEVIAKLKLFAETDSNCTLLDCMILKGWLSAFYGSKGFPNLPTYHQSVPIPGLEDPTETLVVDMSNYREFTDAPNQGPVEKQHFHPSEGTGQPSSENYENVLDDGFHHSRKQKSIAEILEVAKSAQIGRTKSTSRKGANLNKLAVSSSSSTRRSKRKGNDGTNVNDDQTSGSTKTVSKRTKSSGPVRGIRTQTSDSGSDGNSTKEETVKASSKRKHKDGGLDDDSGRENFSSSSMLTNEKMEMLFGLSLVGGDDDDNRKQIEGTYSPRERKRSKYLSPPYTTSNARPKKSDMDSVLPEIQLRERKTEAAGDLLGSPQFLKQCSSLKKKQPEKLVIKEGAGSESSLRTPKECQSFMIDPVKVDAPAYEIISGIKSAAMNPQYSNNFRNGTAGVFFSVFRNSVYRNGCYYKVYNKNESRRKLTSLKSKADGTKREQDEAANGATSESKSQQANFRNNEEAKFSKRKGKQISKTASKQTVVEVLKRHKTKNTPKTPSKSSKEDSDKDASPAVLFVSFGPGPSLPSKEDLIRIFSNYGPLNSNYTDIFVSNNCARIVFRRSFDAEKAFNESQMVCPLGAANITLQLRYLTASYDLRELEDSPTEEGSMANKCIKIPENTDALGQSDGKLSETDYVRQKLEMLTAMLGSSGEKMSSGMKSRFQVELKCLLEKVIKGWDEGIKTRKKTDVLGVCKDGGIFKKILVEGEKWENPKDLDEVFVKYEACLEGTIVDIELDSSSFLAGNYCHLGITYILSLVLNLSIIWYHMGTATIQQKDVNVSSQRKQKVLTSAYLIIIHGAYSTITQTRVFVIMAHECTFFGGWSNGKTSSCCKTKVLISS